MTLHTTSTYKPLCVQVYRSLFVIRINRIGNNGKTISDRNEKYRSTKICRELTERYGLTIGEGKQEVNRSRLRGEDKLRYEIFDTIKAVLPQSQTWKDFVAELEQQGITTRFKTKGNTDVVQDHL